METIHSATQMQEETTNLPICVDLDGTLIQEDVSQLSAKYYLRKHPHRAISLLLKFIVHGTAATKAFLSKYSSVDIQKLSYHTALIQYLQQKRNDGHKIYLATGANETFAQKISDHLQLFDGVFASTHDINLIGKNKAQKLISLFGEKGFIYAGNSHVDIHVWSVSAGYIIVNPDRRSRLWMRDKQAIWF